MNESRKSTFENLECWKVSRDLRIYVVKNILPSLPADEKYRLGDQMLRAARSATANLAEGYGRYHYLDQAKFLSNSRGSLYEVLEHAITAANEELISHRQLETLREKIDLAIKLLNGYRAYLLKKSKS